MAERNKSCQSSQSNKTTTKKAVKRSRSWTEIELKYFALILADKENGFAYKLDTLALKKTANKSIFEQIGKMFSDSMSSEEFKTENTASSKKPLTPLEIDVDKLRAKFKWLKDQWRRLSDRVKKGSGISPIEQPEWYQIINPIFSDTQGCLQPVTQANEILSDSGDSDVDCSEDANGSNQTEHCFDNSSNIGDDESENASDLADGSESSLKRKSAFSNLKVKPIKQKKRVKTQSQAINELARSFGSLGQAQEKRTEMFLQAERERHSEFLAYQKEQAELNRQHELRLAEMFMKYSSHSHNQLRNVPTQQYSAPQMFSSSSGQAPTTQTHSYHHSHQILDLDNQNNPSSMSWY
jgi:hypothetical protein